MGTIEDISWEELANLTHATQVERFGWCICEGTDGEGQLAEDCPIFYCGTCNSDLIGLPDGEYTDPDGRIFCPTTEEIHFRLPKRREK